MENHMYTLQEAMESFAFPNVMNSIRSEILQKCSKLYFFSLESLEGSLKVCNDFSKGKA